MKKNYTFFFLFLITASAFTQSPQKMSYQAVIRNSSNTLVTSSPIGMRISILQGSVTGTTVYVETQTPTTNSNGLVTIEIGSGTVASGTFAAIDWSMGIYFIKTETDPAGGTNYAITGTSQLLSVPYALYAKTSENIGSISFSFTGDTMFLGKNKIIVPGISAANQLKDIDGNIYKTVKIGNQVWMAENLKTTKYNDNIAISNVTDDAIWAALTTPSYCWYNNDINNKDIYGAIYNWYVIDVTTNGNKHVCPVGWHVPSDSEFKTLELYLGMSPSELDNIEWRGTTEGGKLKETGLSHWTEPNTGATNETGFTATPAGARTDHFYNLGNYVNFWTTTLNDANIPIWRGLRFDGATIRRAAYQQGAGLSIRCLKD